MNKTRTIAIVNQKGGVGKTTTTANLAYALAKKGRDVLVIDFDSQASLTFYLNVGTDGGVLGENGLEEYIGVYECLIKQYDNELFREYDEEIYKMTMDELLSKAICTPTWTRPHGLRKTEEGNTEVLYDKIEFGFDLLPSCLDLSDFELQISHSGDLRNKGAIFFLYNLVNQIKKHHAYDYILIDCNPSLGIMTLNAVLAATSGVLIPTNLDLMSTRGVKNLINKIVEVQELCMNTAKINHMGVIGVVLNLFSPRRRLDATIQDDMKRFYPFKIFENAIPESVNARAAASEGKIYSQLYKKAEDSYGKLAKEIEEQIEEMEKKGPVIMRVDDNSHSPVEEEE